MLDSHITLPCCAVALRSRFQSCRWPMGDLPGFGFFGLSRGVSRLAVRSFPATRGFWRRTWHCRRTAGAQHYMCELTPHGTAVALHGMCCTAVHRITRHSRSFSRVRKIAKSDCKPSSCLSVRLVYPHGTTGRSLIKFDIWAFFFRKSVEKIKSQIKTWQESPVL